MAPDKVAVLTYVPKDLRMRLKVRAAQLGRTTTSLIVEACEKFLAADGSDGRR